MLPLDALAGRALALIVVHVPLGAIFRNDSVVGVSFPTRPPLRLDEYEPSYVVRTTTGTVHQLLSRPKPSVALTR